MDEEDQKALDSISRLFSSPPHTITPREGFRMIFRQDYNPWTRRPAGPPYLNPFFLAGLKRQGVDVDEFARRIEAKLRADGIWPED